MQQLADEAARLGRLDVAQSLKVCAELAAAAEPFAQIYDSIRHIAPGVDERTEALDALVRLVARQVAEGPGPCLKRVRYSTVRTVRLFALAMLRAFRLQTTLISLSVRRRPQDRGSSSGTRSLWSS